MDQFSNKWILSLQSNILVNFSLLPIFLIGFQLKYRNRGEGESNLWNTNASMKNQVILIVTHWKSKFFEKKKKTKEHYKSSPWSSKQGIKLWPQEQYRVPRLYFIRSPIIATPAIIAFAFLGIPGTQSPIFPPRPYVNPIQHNLVNFIE